MDVNHSLTEQEVAEGMILTCQAHPVTEKVAIDFDF
jgi:ring-1,2-phenylacetyl-CoA epoxidase subunit PaaE